SAGAPSGDGTNTPPARPSPAGIGSASSTAAAGSTTTFVSFAEASPLLSPGSPSSDGPRSPSRSVHGVHGVVSTRSPDDLPSAGAVASASRFPDRAGRPRSSDGAEAERRSPVSRSGRSPAAASRAASNAGRSAATAARWDAPRAGVGGGAAGAAPGAGRKDGRMTSALQREGLDENLVRDGDGARVGLVAALREDHLRELLRDVHVRLLDGAADQRAAAAGAGRADVRNAGRLALAVAVAPELHEPLRVVEVGHRELSHCDAFTRPERRDDPARAVDGGVAALPGRRSVLRDRRGLGWRCEAGQRRLVAGRRRDVPDDVAAGGAVGPGGGADEVDVAVGHGQLAV